MWWKKVTSLGKSCLRCGDGMLMDWGRQKVYKCNPVMSPCEYEHPDISFFFFLFHKQKALEMYINKVLSSSLLNTSCFCFKDGLGVFLFLLLFSHSAICILFISHIGTTDEFSFPCDSFISEKNGKIPAESAFYKLVDQIEGRMDADCWTKPWDASVRVPGTACWRPAWGRIEKNMVWII